MQQISGERLQDHWSSGFCIYAKGMFYTYIYEIKQWPSSVTHFLCMGAGWPSGRASDYREVGVGGITLSWVMRKTTFCICENKGADQLRSNCEISTFVFATWIVQFLFFLNPKFPASSHLDLF